MRGGLVAALLLLALTVAASPSAAKSVTKTKKFVKCVTSAVPILDRQTSAVSIRVPVPRNGGKVQQGSVTALGVFIQINHTNDADLDISLVSPAGRAVALAIARGGGGDGYGSGTPCLGPGAWTWFNDSFSTPIASGVAPFSGTFRPDQPLSALYGGAANGNWTLVVSDHAAADTGSIGALMLRVDYRYRQRAKGK